MAALTMHIVQDIITKLVTPQKILDVGTGTGIWAIEMGDEYPSAEVIGTDLSPIQPGWVPPNVRFEIDDATQEWDYPEESALKPGGHIELSECRTHMECDDGTYPVESWTYKWIEEFNNISHSNGMIFDMFPNFAGLLRGGRFENVEVFEQPCPIGVWPKDKKLKEMGRAFRASFLDGALDSFSLALFTRFADWTPEEVQVLLAHVREEIRSNKMHVYTHCSYATAQKPMRYINHD
ncbi:putative phosphoethanolamine n [Phaeomoniella chlamydospora]|uniref:Putative phosphoethanolamine n n=1 Tax=Phaeomoniella chlamydospora TaxID=158046 RepID=A0A0G2GNF0_PHACM|nr:putative phosphoethanolamine n [Phaeomoniella chlamydospora]